MKYNNDVIEQINSHVDIIEIIGEYVQLKKAGNRYVGLCPFHEDKKSPSFSVSPDRGVYHCFGCKKSGNVFTFLKDFLGLSFPESIELLAKRYGIVLAVNEDDKQKDDKRGLVLKALQSASEYYSNFLYLKEGETALKYFRKRNFSTDLIKQFQLGASAPIWDGLISHLKNNGFNEENALDAGLVVKHESGRVYDRFRNRAMFAIRDFLGRVVGFGARQIDDEPNQPKYINSPQSIVYDKSKVIYGLYEAKNAIRNKQFALMTEGYADVLSLHQAGYANAIASSGTALTSDQLKLLSRYTKRIYLVFDSDEAGEKATLRAIELGAELGFDVFVVRLPQGEDPDSIIRENGAAVFENYIKAAQSFLEYLFFVFKKGDNFTSPQAKADNARYLVKIVSKIPDRLQHDFYLNQIASYFDLTESQIEIIYKEKKVLDRDSLYAENKKSDIISNSSHQPIKITQDIDLNQHAKDDIKQFDYNHDDIPLPEYENYDLSIDGNKTLSEIPLPDEYNSIDLIEDKFPTEILAKEKENIDETDYSIDFNTLYAEEKMLLNICLNNRKAFKIIIDEHNFRESNMITDAGKLLFEIIFEYNEETEILNKIIMDDEISDEIKNCLSNIAFAVLFPSESWQKFGTEILAPDYKKMLVDILNRLELHFLDRQVLEIRNNLKNAEDDESDGLLVRIMELTKIKSDLLENMQNRS